MIDKQFETMLSQHMKKAKNTQMTDKEYRYIAEFLNDKNFLVFGTGHDTPMWRYANKNGTTLFLENDVRWIKPEDTDVIEVVYNTKRSQYKQLLEEYNSGIFDNLKMDLPKIVTETKWDYIFVDSPIGKSDESPGRMQSIFTASILSSKDTNVFIHDCDRKVEDIYSKAMFSNVVKDLIKLRHVKL